jgi:uncharacterized protein YecE (DUF72 family)
MIPLPLDRDPGEKVIIIAMAGWSIPKTVARQFPTSGSTLQKYASVFSGVEINSTFYRHHKVSTFIRWAESVPDHFRFAVKIPREITHQARLINIVDPFEIFLGEVSGLGKKLGPLLCQLPPSFAFDAQVIETAFREIRARYEGVLVIEVRHRSWANKEAVDLLNDLRIERVFADPAPVWKMADFEKPPSYIRLHGQPEMYYSNYAEDEVSEFVKLAANDSWIVFDNTALGHAIENALASLKMIQGC